MNSHAQNISASLRCWREWRRKKPWVTILSCESISATNKYARFSGNSKREECRSTNGRWRWLTLCILSCTSGGLTDMIFFTYLTKISLPHHFPPHFLNHFLQKIHQFFLIMFSLLFWAFYHVVDLQVHFLEFVHHFLFLYFLFFPLFTHDVG